MQAYKLDTCILENHRLEITLPDNFPAGEAEVIILAKPGPDTGAELNLRQFSAWLKQQKPRGRSREEIDAQIAEERDSWGED
jgi:hypothetical protein